MFLAGQSATNNVKRFHNKKKNTGCCRLLIDSETSDTGKYNFKNKKVR